MTSRTLSLLLAVALPSFAAPEVRAQRPPDTVFLEELTWDELRELQRSGTTTVILATAGTEQKGPHMVMGEHKFAVTYTAERIARALGHTVVAPIITYVPEGSWDPPYRGHMAKAGSITLPEDRFVELLLHAGRSLRAGGFKRVILIGDSGGNQKGMQTAAATLNAEWGTLGAQALFVGDYYTKSVPEMHTYLQGKGFDEESIGSHAGMLDTSELMFVNPSLVRRDKLANRGGFTDSGVSGDPTKATPEIGEALLRIKIDNALAQIRGTFSDYAAGKATTPRPSTRTSTGAPFIEEMTWTEVRDAIAGGTKAVIVPTGGTEQNGPHMVLGKHNYIVTHAARQIAAQIGALVAPTVQYVPEGDFTKPDFGEKPGVISLMSPAYDRLLDAAARSLRVHGFTDILLIGDSGGNQNGMVAVADALNREWAGSGVRVHALVQYYRKGRTAGRDWLKAQYGWDEQMVGSHAGTSDTSQLLYVHAAGIRLDKRAPNGGSPDSGVTGDPTKATAEIGKKIVQIKVDAALEQYAREKGEGAKP